MKYRLGDICTITKGATGIIKAIPGDYTMITLGETNKTHNEYQFNAKAVIIPLVSSTGHGHASMKRVKYCEGKFAIGNILCAVIPKDENFVLAKYLQIYLHWNREELLVSQMRGMANVSLSMNKIADVIVTVPNIDKQKEIVELERKLVEKQLQTEKIFADQFNNLENLNQAILQEAVQGKLVPQNPKDEPANELLKRIKAEKAKFGKKEKLLLPIKTEEVPFEIPESWEWCRLGEITNIKRGKGPKYSEKGIYKMLNQKCVRWYEIDLHFCKAIDAEWFQSIDNEFKVQENDILVNSTGDGTIGRSAIAIKDAQDYIFDSHILKISSEINQWFICYFINSNYGQQQVENSKGAKSTKQHELGVNNLSNFIFPLPPLSEQKRIVAELEKQLSKTKELKEHVLTNQQATEQLLKALLHEAFEVKEEKTIKSLRPKEQAIELSSKTYNSSEKAILAGHIINMTNNEGFGRVKFQKLLYLTEHHCRLNLGSNYMQNVAGPYDGRLIKEVESTLKRYKFYDIRKSKTSNHVDYTALSAAPQLENMFAQNFPEESSAINDFLFKFKNSSWEQCEIVATLYAVWNNRILRREQITDELLKTDFLNWDPQKAKYKNRLDKGLSWMKEQGIVPDGWGKVIGKLKE